MAMVETPDRIMTTGGWDGNGGSMIWIILFAFLFMFRGGHGGFGCGDGGHHEKDRYTRHDADFRELRYEHFAESKESMKEHYEGMLRAEKCCCETNQHIKDVKCEVAEQGEKTRALMVSLEKDEAIRRLQAENVMLATQVNNGVIIRGVLEALRCERSCFPEFRHCNDDERERGRRSA